jgi:SAM-dependent methyltransferase
VTYTDDFFAAIRPGIQSSANSLVPLLYSLFTPRTVVDVGCGEGWWLRRFLDIATVEGLGIDSDANADITGIPFRRHDLTQPLPDLGHFDLALCLEVAEHLPETVAARFVRDLCQLAPLVVFSAAVPGQGGMHHCNEQWPDYWADLFRGQGFAVTGNVRYQIWGDPMVEPWYRQNLLVCADQRTIDDTVSLINRGVDATMPLALVHPDLFAAVAERTRQ